MKRFLICLLICFLLISCNYPDPDTIEIIVNFNTFPPVCTESDIEIQVYGRLYTGFAVSEIKNIGTIHQIQGSSTSPIAIMFNPHYEYLAISLIDIVVMENSNAAYNGIYNDMLTGDPIKIEIIDWKKLDE